MVDASVSVVIPSYNGMDLLADNLRSIVDELGGLEVTIVDDASTDGSVKFVRENFSQVRVLARAHNSGFSVAVNEGIRASSGEFVAVLNNDVEVTQGFLDAILPMFDDESVFAVSPQIILPSKNNLDEGAKTGYWHHGMFYTDQRQGVSQVTPVIYTTACAAVYRRSMLEALGGFDEAYSPFYWEDTDLGYRAWKRGWKSLYQPDSMVYHQHSATISRLKSTYKNRIQVRNSLFFIWRNIDDAGLLSKHRRLLVLVLLKRALCGDKAFILGWKDAYLRRREAVAARAADAHNRQFSDREIFKITGVSI